MMPCSMPRESLLFRKGYKERGHFAMIDALRGLYKNNSEVQDYVRLLDSYRMTRHSIQYNGSLSSELDAIAIVKDAEKFIKFVAELV